MDGAAPDVMSKIHRYSEQVRRDPKSLVFALLADALREAGQLDSARRVCEHGLRIHPSYATARIILGQVLRAAGDVAAAQEQFEITVREHPNNLVARIALAQILIDRGDARGALEHLEHVLLVNPGNPVALGLREQARNVAASAAVPAFTGVPAEAAPTEKVPPAAGAILDDLLANLRATEGVVGALLVGNDGLPVAGEVPATVPDTVMGALFAEISNNVKKYVGGMQFGEFVSGMIDGTEGNMVLNPMKEFLLVVVTEPNAKLGLINVEIERTRRALAAL